MLIPQLKELTVEFTNAHTDPFLCSLSRVNPFYEYYEALPATTLYALDDNQNSLFRQVTMVKKFGVILRPILRD